ncbi:MAG: PLP-dependent lyase/thiolase [Patescibacteria group bacterium]
MITPLEKFNGLAKVLKTKELYFKREDLHPYGSHKGRSIPIMIDHYYQNGDRTFAISSSGNAALAAAIHAQKLNNIKLDIFVGNHVSPEKLKKIRAIAEKSIGNIRVLVKERPLQALIQATQEGVRSLRQSTDDQALMGYQSLAEELTQTYNAQKIGAIFIGTSSGTTAQALAQYFLDKKIPIQVHIIQTSSCHPISEQFEPYDGPDERSIADAITDITGHRKSALMPLIEKTGGKGWIATNEDIKTAQKLVSEHTKLNISTNSALSIVGIMKANYVGHKIDGAIVCMICGE